MSEMPSGEAGHLNAHSPAGYGTLPSTFTQNGGRKLIRNRRVFPPLSSVVAGQNVPGSTVSSPGVRRPASFFANLPPFHRQQLTYDPPLSPKESEITDSGRAARVNGIRVWYSSFTSIDWLHDAIKDSRRMLSLRRRKSLRGRAKNALDRATGWFVVTIVGLLAAITAFTIVRLEQWLFDLKEGYCTEGIFKAKRFCCPMSADSGGVEEPCAAWETWAELLGAEERLPKSWDIEGWLVEYLSYIIVALLLALGSTLLTLHLSASTSFIGRKDSPGVNEGTDRGSGGIAAPATRKVLYFAAGSGIPEIKTILSGFVIHGYLGGRVLFAKSVGLAMSVASGLSLGKEGPFVHIVSCIGNIVSRFFKKYETNEAKRREVLSAAGAAGVAVAFGAPVGGTLFSLEEISYFFPPKVMWRSFFCAMIAAATLKFLNPFGTGKTVLFQVTYDQDWHAYELVLFVLLGIFGGLYGAYFSKLNYRWSRDVRNGTWLGKHPISEVMLITLITALLSFLNPYTRMGGTELVYNLFAECRPDNDHGKLCVTRPEQIVPVIRAIAVALLVKGGLTIVTFGIKLPAGIFIPTLGVGACAGRILGLCVQWLSLTNPNLWIFDSCGSKNAQCVVPGVYAMVGAAATLSGVTRTTVSLAVIMFELTGTLTYVVPVMLSVLVAKTVADALEPKGVYDLVIELNQLPYLDHKAEYLWGDLQVEDVADRNVDVINIDDENTVATLRTQLSRVFSLGSLDGGFPIVTRVDMSHAGPGGLKMIGYIAHNELEHALNVVQDEPDAPVHFHATQKRPRDYASSTISSLYDTPLEPDPLDFTVYMDQAPLTITSHSPLELVQQLFVKLGARYVVVVNSDGHYEGVIEKKGWLEFLGELEHKA